MQTYVDSHAVARAILLVSLVASPLLEGAVTAFERVRTERGSARAAGGAFVETATLRTGSGSGQDRGTKWILVGSMIAAVLLGWRAAERFPGAAMPGGGAFLFVFGLLMLWAGVALRLWSIGTLGRYFRRVVVIQEGHRVVTAGPYGLVRHPSYLGNLLAAAGLGIALGNWVSLAILVVIPTLGHLPRIWVEERALEESLGAEYSGYAGNRKRLVPGIW